MSLIFICLSTSAQDKITKHTGEIILCNIVEVEDFYIHFYERFDTNELLLYKMDVALVQSIKFDSEYDIIDNFSLEETYDLPSNFQMVKTNVDGLLYRYISFYYQNIREKFAFDGGLKYNFDESSEIIEHNGFSVELGASFPLRLLGTEDRPLRILYLRGHMTYSRGTYFDLLDFFNGRLEYTEINIGGQLVLDYQLTNRLVGEVYFGVSAPIIKSDGDIPDVRRGDFTGSSGILRVLGVRFGYLL